MSLPALCQWIQDTAFSTAVRESTWGFPILGALHVLSIAWFGGVVLVDHLSGLVMLRLWKRIGLAALLVTGALLFWIEPLKCYQSIAFRVKMVLLLLVLADSSVHRKAPTRVAGAVSSALWAALIFAARGIAFF